MNEWKTFKLKDLADITRGGSPRPIEKYITTGDGYNWLRIGDVPKDGKFITKVSAKIKPEGLSKSTLVHDGDFILSNSMSFGRPYIMKVDTCIHDGWLALRNLQKDKIDRNFLYYLLLTPMTQYKFSALSAGSGVQNLKKETVKEIEVIIPPVEEQTRIVEVLETWHEYLEALDKKIELKRTIKKALLQQLLTGAKRLPGFNAAWKEMSLGDLYKITSSKRVFESDWMNEGVPFYRAREVIKLRNHGHVDNELFITKSMFDEYKVKYGSVKKNDILVTGVGTVGVAYRVQDFTNFYFKDGNIIWLKDQAKVSSVFIEQVFKSDIIRRQIHRFTPITTVATYTIEMANSTKVPLPPRDEQDAISGVLIKADKEIADLNRLKVLISKQKDFLSSNLLIGTIQAPENINLSKMEAQHA